MPDNPISLALPPLKPGDQPPDKCPGCGAACQVAHAPRDKPMELPGVYVCGANLRGQFEAICPNPTPAAVLRALLESGVEFNDTSAIEIEIDWFNQQ